MSTVVAPVLVVAALDEAVAALAWSADGGLLAVADLGGRVTLLDVGRDLDTVRSEGRYGASHPRALVAGHPGGAAALAWHPVRPILASGGMDGAVALWDGAGGPAVRVECGAAVHALAWSPTGDLLAIAAGFSVLVVDDHGAHIAAYPLLAGAVHDLAWVPGPAPLAAGTHAGIAWLAPGLGGAEPVASDPVAGAALVLAADPTLTRLASGDLAGEVRVHDLGTDEELGLRGWVEPITALAWDAEGHHLAVVGGEFTVWRLDGTDVVGDEPIRPTGLRGRIDALAFAGGSAPIVAAGGDDGIVARWPLTRPDDPVVDELDSPVQALAWRPDTTSLAAGSRAGTVVLLDTSAPT